MLRVATALYLLICVAGCASSRPQPTTDRQQLELDALPPHTTDPRQCSLVLFTREAESRRIALALDTPAILILQSGGRPLHLSRTDHSQPTSFGHAPTQNYRSPTGIQARLDVELTPLPGGEPGATVRSGSLAFTNVAGETHVLPVVGLLSCGPQAEGRRG